MIGAVMEILKFTQTAVGEFRAESHMDFCLHGFNNDIVLYSNSNEFYILDLMYNCDFLNNIPYRIKHVKVLQEKPLVNLVKHVDYMTIYKNGSVLESQELAIDHIYVADCSMEPPKPRLIKAELVPAANTSKLCCVLTSYGACDMLAKDPISLEWYSLNTKLNQLLIGDVFAMRKSPSNIETFSDLRNFVDTYYITYFAWHSRDIIYLGTAKGCIVALKYLENEKEFKMLAKIHTSLGRISYLTTVNNIILAGCSQGQLRLIKFDENKKSLHQLDHLWSKKDRMACCKAIITYNEDLGSYLVVFCKAAHILAFRLDSEGCIISKSNAHLRGVKITGRFN